MKDFELTFVCPGDCQTTLSANSLLESTRHFPVAICPQCDRLIEIDSGGSVGGGGPYDFRSWHIDVRVLSALALKEIPDEIVRTIKEAVRAYGVGSNYACVAMCRRVVEGIVISKGAQGRSLKEKIDNLGNRQLISERVERYDGYVRSLGNIACHFETIPEHEISQEDAWVCLLTAYDVIVEVFLGEEHAPHRRHLPGY